MSDDGQPKQPQGITSDMLQASGAMGSHPVSSQAIQGSGGGAIMAFEGKELPTIPNAEIPIGFQSMDGIFAPINSGGGLDPFGTLKDVANHLVAQEAQGEKLSLDELGKGERQQPPQITDAGIKPVGLVGAPR
jgi:hypothetical protein